MPLPVPKVGSYRLHDVNLLLTQRKGKETGGIYDLRLAVYDFFFRFRISDLIFCIKQKAPVKPEG
jgi:hypothetical protein